MATENKGIEHRQLQASLADHLRKAGWLVFTEIELPGTGDDRDDVGGRADVIAVKPRVYARKDLRCYEVKASRADFTRDVGSNKWYRYLEVVHRFFFAVPAGLVKTDEVPQGAGLIARGDKGWVTVKAARPHQPARLTADTVFALLYRGVNEARGARDLRQRVQFGPNGEAQEALNLGWDIRRKLNSREANLTRPLQALKEMIERETGEELGDDFSVESQMRGLEEAFWFLRERQRHRRVIGAMVSYLSNLGTRYFDAERSEGQLINMEQVLIVATKT